jgi:hypothetical protein
MQITVFRIAGESFRLLGRNLWRALPVWLFAIVTFTGTNLIDIVYGAPVTGHGFTAAQIVSLAIRVVAPLIVSSALFRVMLGSTHGPWSPDGAFWKYVLATALISGVAFGIAIAGVRGLRPQMLVLVHDRAGQMIASGATAFAFILLGAILTIRLSLWPVALAIGDRAVTFVMAWRRTRGAVWAMTGALLLLAAPWIAAHFAATVWALSLSGQARVMATVIDGLVSVLQVASGIAVASASYRLLASPRLEASLP